MDFLEAVVRILFLSNKKRAVMKLAKFFYILIVGEFVKAYRLKAGLEPCSFPLHLLQLFLLLHVLRLPRTGKHVKNISFLVVLGYSI